MGKLIYSMLTSLDGYISDRNGNFDWAFPDPEVHDFINKQALSTGVFLFGRKMYETMVYWETAHLQPDQTPTTLEWTRVWQAACKIVYSTTLDGVASERTRLERAFNPDAVSQLKADTALDLTISGPNLAAQAIRAGLVDEFQPYICPVIVGGGKPFLPANVRIDMNLLDEQRFDNGFIFLRYGVKSLD